MNDWLARFESIGDNCEFGFVQRAFGVERSAIGRWGSFDSVDATARLIRTGFEGIFQFENLVPAGGGAMVQDVTAGVAFHTDMKSAETDQGWVFLATEDERRKIHARESQKLDYLRGKFNQDIAGDQRIYVAKHNNGLTDAEAAALFEAIASKGGGALLYLTATDDPKRLGTAVLDHPRLAHGWVDRFAPYNKADDISLVHWEAVLRSAARLFGDTAPLPAGHLPASFLQRLKPGLRAMFGLR